MARRAAVLLPFRACGNEVEELVLTRRADALDVHAGQVAFPGGRIEANDASPEAAALREAREELGLSSEQVRIVGRLDEMVTITNFHVTPVVGIVQCDVALRPDPEEVARVFGIPVVRLLDPQGWEQREHEYRGNLFRVWHFPYDGEDVWGVTGIILRGLVELMWSVA
ncbi:MAG: CoA pyrophosphatase [Myxococcota bacterium]